MRRALGITLVAAAIAASIGATAALARERAGFIRGSFATADGCRKLEAIANGGPRNVATVPDVLTADGFKGWEGACEFTKVFEHEPGQSWVALMLCSEGATTTPATYAFVKSGDDAFDVSLSGGAGEPEEWKRCAAADAAAAREKK